MNETAQIPQSTIWIVIAAMAVGCFALRFLFIGLVGDRPLPPWLLKLLRYTAVSILPALIAPLVIWPASSGGQTDPLKLAAAAITLAAAYVTKNVLIAVMAGAMCLLLLPAIFL